MIITPILIALTCVGCFLCSCNRMLCYKNTDRVIGGRGIDSESEDDNNGSTDIQYDGSVTVHRRSPSAKKFFRKQFTFAVINFLCGLFYLAVSGFALFSLKGTQYDVQSAKPLNITAEFTYKIRDWAVKPYTQITVQSTPCLKPKEPLFIRYWNGTNEFTDCTGGSCTLQPAIAPIN